MLKVEIENTLIIVYWHRALQMHPRPDVHYSRSQGIDNRQQHDLCVLSTAVNATNGVRCE